MKRECPVIKDIMCFFPTCYDSSYGRVWTLTLTCPIDEDRIMEGFFHLLYLNAIKVSIVMIVVILLVSGQKAQGMAHVNRMIHGLSAQSGLLMTEVTLLRWSVSPDTVKSES